MTLLGQGTSWNGVTNLTIYCLFYVIELLSDLEQCPGPDQALEALYQIAPLAEMVRVLPVGPNVFEQLRTSIICGFGG
jgi:hypothetical protein